MNGLESVPLAERSGFFGYCGKDQKARAQLEGVASNFE